MNQLGSLESKDIESYLQFTGNMPTSDACNECKNIIDPRSTVFVCNLCNSKFHGVKECCGVQAKTVKEAQSSNGQVRLLCVKCKGFDFADLVKRVKVLEKKATECDESPNAAISMNDFINEYAERQEKPPTHKPTGSHRKGRRKKERKGSLLFSKGRLGWIPKIN